SPSSIHRKPAAVPAFAPSPSSSIHNYANRIATPTSANNAPISPVSSASSQALPSIPIGPPSVAPAIPQSSSTRMPLSKAQIDAALKRCLELQNTATSLHEKRPFAALLLGPDNATVLLTHFSISHVQHAETELARLASIHFSQKYLESCTLVSTWEP